MTTVPRNMTRNNGAGVQSDQMLHFTTSFPLRSLRNPVLIGIEVHPNRVTQICPGPRRLLEEELLMPRHDGKPSHRHVGIRTARALRVIANGKELREYGDTVGYGYLRQAGGGAHACVRYM